MQVNNITITCEMLDNYEKSQQYHQYRKRLNEAFNNFQENELVIAKNSMQPPKKTKAKTKQRINMQINQEDHAELWNNVVKMNETDLKNLRSELIRVEYIVECQIRKSKRNSK